MLRSAMLASALATMMFGSAQAGTTTDGDTADDGALVQNGLLLAQAGGGGSGDSAGRGPDTSKGAVPKNPEPYPSGIQSPGTAPVPSSPGSPQSKPAEGSSAVTPGADSPTTGTGLKSPGTTQQGGTKRSEP